MKFRRLIPLIFAARSLFFTQPAVAQDFNDTLISPRAEIEFVDGIGRVNSSLDIILDKNQKSGDLEFILNSGKIEQKFGLNFLINNDPVWTTINGGVKYGFDWNPVPFLKQELKTYTGYQHISNVTAPFLYYAGQFFTGGEENLSFVLGKPDKPRLEATGILGGYVTFLNKSLVWDNYKAGYKISGTLPISFFDFGAWFNQIYTQFNKDKYFFVDSSNKISFGANAGLNLQELALNAFFEKEYTFGKEIDGEKIYTGISALFKEAGVGIRGNVELNQLYPELFYVTFGAGKTLFSDRAYAEVSFGLFDNKPSLELRLRINPGNQNANKIIIKKPLKRTSPLIEQQGYKKPSEDFDETINETNTLTKLGNVGVYFPYATGVIPTRNPEKFFEDGYGDCDEIAWYRTYAARKNGYENSWFVGYFSKGASSGHAFFLVQDKDGRVYVTDNDHGAWLRVNVDEDASKEEMAKAAIEQLSRYMALIIPEGKDYSFVMFDDKYEVSGSQDVSGFQSKHEDYVPIDTGLMSRTGSSAFY